MTDIARKSDGRRIFTDAFKQEQIGRVWRGELTVAQLGRELGIARSLLQRWKRNLRQGVRSAARDRATPAGRPGAATYIRELQLLVGKQTVELERLRADLEAIRRRTRPPRAPAR